MKSIIYILYEVIYTQTNASNSSFENDCTANHVIVTKSEDVSCVTTAIVQIVSG